MTKLSNGLNPVFLIQLRIWFRTGSYFIRWHIAVCVRLFKQTKSSLKWTSEVVPSHYFLQGRGFSRVTVINGPTVISKSWVQRYFKNRGNSSTRSLKTPVVSCGHFDFTGEEPGTVQKRIELWDSFGDTIARIGCCKVEQGTGWKFTIPTHLIPPPHPNRPI